MVIVLLLSSAAKPLQEFTLVTWVNVGRHQVAVDSQAKLQTWPSSPLVDYHCHYPSPFALLLNHKAYFTVPQRVEGWVDLGFTVRMFKPKAVYNSGLL